MYSERQQDELSQEEQQTDNLLLDIDQAMEFFNTQMVGPIEILEEIALEEVIKHIQRIDSE